MSRQNKKNEAVVYWVLGMLFLLLGCVVAFVVIVPTPLNPTEQTLVGPWEATEGGKAMTFNPDRTVDVTNTSVSPDLVIRWKLDGSSLGVKEGRGPWEYHDVRIDDGSLSVMRDGKPVLQMVRVPK